MIIYNGIEINEVAYSDGILTVKVPDIRLPEEGDELVIGDVSYSIADVGANNGNWLLTIEGDE